MRNPHMRSAICEAESKLPSDWPASITWMWGGRRLVQMLRKKSSSTCGARLLRCRINWEGLWSPISSSMRSWRTRSRDVYNRRTSSVFSFWYGYSASGDMITSATSAACLWSSWEIM